MCILMGTVILIIINLIIVAICSHLSAHYILSFDIWHDETMIRIAIIMVVAGEAPGATERVLWHWDDQGITVQWRNLGFGHYRVGGHGVTPLQNYSDINRGHRLDSWVCWFLEKVDHLLLYSSGSILSGNSSCWFFLDRIQRNCCFFRWQL